MTPLRAVTVRVDLDLDPIAIAGDDGVVWMHDGFALAGLGTAGTIDLGGVASPAAESAPLAHIHSTTDLDRAGTGAVAFGALDFERRADQLSGSLVVPEVVYGRDRDGNRFRYAGDGHESRHKPGCRDQYRDHATRTQC